MTGHESVHLSPRQLLLGGAAAFLLGGYAFMAGWLNWAGLFRLHPLLSLPCTLSLLATPLLLYISLRQMTENGMKRHALTAAALSASALGLVVLGMRLWLQHLAG